jgi:hypothetical protein
MGLSHKSIAIACTAANLLFIIMAYVLRSQGSLVVITALASASILSVIVIKYRKPRKKIMVTNGHLHEEPIISTRKIFTIAGETVEQE